MSENDRMRQMRMTPLEAREQNGLKGFGFTVSWADDNGEWIDHQGQCPVARDTMVDVRFQDGDVSYLSRADYWYWDATGDGAIVAYRVVKP